MVWWHAKKRGRLHWYGNKPVVPAMQPEPRKFKTTTMLGLMVAASGLSAASFGVLLAYKFTMATETGVDGTQTLNRDYVLFSSESPCWPPVGWGGRRAEGCFGSTVTRMHEESVCLWRLPAVLGPLAGLIVVSLLTGAYLLFTLKDLYK